MINELFFYRNPFDTWSSTDWMSGQSVVAQLPQSLLQELNRTIDRKHLNPLVTPATPRTYREAKKWLAWGIRSLGNNIVPTVSLPGGGDIVIRWSAEGGFVCIHFDADTPELDAVFYDIDGKIANEELDERLVENLIARLVSDGNLSSASPVDSKDQISFPPDARIQHRYLEATAT